MEELEFKEEEEETREYLLIPGEREDDDLIGYEEPVPHEEALFGIIDNNKIEYDSRKDELGFSKCIVKSLFLEKSNEIYPKNSNSNYYEEHSERIFVFTWNKMYILNTFNMTDGHGTPTCLLYTSPSPRDRG